MSSLAARKYKLLSANATIIWNVERKSVTYQKLQVLYGAAFVSQVAAWNAYVSNIIINFFDSVTAPFDRNFSALHALSMNSAEARLKKFSTPNSENTRNLMIACTGYDPWMDWQWPRRTMNALATRARLDEALKVRHSLAHGFSMPTYNWNTNKAGEVRLTMGIISWHRAFFDNLVLTTDKGLSYYIAGTYGVEVGW